MMVYLRHFVGGPSAPKGWSQHIVYNLPSIASN